MCRESWLAIKDALSGSQGQGIQCSALVCEIHKTVNTLHIASRWVSEWPVLLGGRGEGGNTFLTNFRNCQNNNNTSGKNHFHEMSGDVGMAGWK